MDGIVIIDKPAGKTSHDVVSEVKKIMGAKKAGHTGTLDPMATGVLPVCLNEATKLAQFLSGENKEYRKRTASGRNARAGIPRGHCHTRHSQL